MFKRKWVFIMLTAALLFAMTAGVLYARPYDNDNRGRDRAEGDSDSWCGDGWGARDGSGWGGGLMGMHYMLPGWLDLTDDQYNKLEDIYDSYYDNHEQFMNDMHDAHVALFDLIYADVQDENAIKDAAQKWGDLQAEMIVDMAGLTGETMKILTADQKALLDDWMMNRGSGYGPGMMGDREDDSYGRRGRCGW